MCRARLLLLWAPLLLAAGSRGWAAPPRPPSRCDVMLDEVCRRLLAGDRKGADAFLLDDDRSFTFESLPGDQGAVVSCAPARRSLRISYANGSRQEVGVTFVPLGKHPCGAVGEVSIGPRSFLMNGTTYFDFSISGFESADGGPPSKAVSGGNPGPNSATDPVAAARPEKAAGPRGRLIEGIEAEIRAHRRRLEK